MRRSRPETDPGMTRAASPPLGSPPPPPPPMPTPLDWERIGGPSCCVCRQVYFAEAGDEHSNSNSNNHAPSSRRGGPGAGGEESFVVLPDSAPVLSEDYFTLARNHNSNNNLALASSGTSTSTAFSSNADTTTTTAGGVRLASGGSSLAPGSELLESRYGGSGGFGGGWTGSSFGVGSSMLDSIVQISHAGLSDNVRRESLLYDLSKRPARWPPGGGGDDGPTAAGKAGDRGEAMSGGDGDDGDGDGGGQEEEEEEEHDPTLCCHCYASLLDQIDEDSRLADREALAYRDFIELLDGVSAEASGSNTKHNNEPSPSPSPSSPYATTAKSKAGDRPAAAAADTIEDQDNKPGGDGTRKKETERDGDGGTGGPPRPSSGRAPKGGGEMEMQTDAADSTSPPSPSPYAQALRIAEQTSVQLRTELGSLETQRGSLCARGSEAWAALSELAYARGVLGDECRELLQVSREVCRRVDVGGDGDGDFDVGVGGSSAQGGATCRFQEMCAVVDIHVDVCRCGASQACTGRCWGFRERVCEC